MFLNRILWINSMFTLLVISVHQWVYLPAFERTPPSQRVQQHGRCWNMLLICDSFPCQSFWLIALCCLWACALMYNRTGNACRVCGRALRNDVFLFMREMKSAEGKREIKGRGWIQEHSLMWPRLYCWCSGLSLFTTSCSKSAWIWLKEGFFTNAVNSWKDVWLSDQLKQGAGPCLFTDIY